MSDLQKRNTEAMISATARFDANVSELRLMVTSMSAKVTTLALEVEILKREAIMAKVARVMGNGGVE